MNSTHHQAIPEPVDPFVATARASDGLVEAMELKPEFAGAVPFLLAVQFHPERLVEKGDHYLRLFRAFVKACGNAPRHPVKKQNGFVRKNGLLSRAANLISSNR